MPEASVVRPFRIDVPAEPPAALRRRIEATGAPSEELVTDGPQGVQRVMLQLSRRVASA